MSKEQAREAIPFDHTNPEEIDRLAAQYGRPFVVRNKESLDRATGGLISPKTLANKDCRDDGPKGKVLIAGKVAYPTREFYAWLLSQVRNS